MPQITKQILGGMFTPGPEFDDILAAAKAGKLIQWWDPYANGGAAWVDGKHLGLTDARKNYRVKPEPEVPVIKTGINPYFNHIPGPEFDDIIAAAKAGEMIIQCRGRDGTWEDKDSLLLKYRRECTRPLGPFTGQSAGTAEPQYPSPKVTSMPKITRHEAPVVTPPPTFTLNLSEAELAFVAGVTGRIAGPTEGVRGISEGLWKAAMHALGIHQTSGLLNAKEGLMRGCLHISTTVAELTENLRALQAQAK